MKKLYPFTTSSWPIIIWAIVLLSCVQPTGNKPHTLTSDSKLAGDGTLPTKPIETILNTSILTPRVELSHLIDPFDGTYKKKLTIPKNFKGNLYLAGLNISALTNKIISVRFNFGVDRQSVTLKATVARAPGIIPKTDIQVLVIDMNSSPFNSMRLTYDLFDYNNYTLAPTKEMVSDARDGGLYCRGLRIEDDPTFVALSESSLCSSASDKCLYSYAKIVDSTLYSDQVINGVTQRITSLPVRPQIWTETSSIRNPLLSSILGSVCLPDDDSFSTINQLFNLSLSTLAYDNPLLGYFYRGPYRSINDSDWQIKGAALFNSTNGLFQTQSILSSETTGFHSLLFPRSGKLSLGQGVSYLGSSEKIGARSKLIADSTGTSQYVDGCNIRILNTDPASNESISSCNVDGSIDVFYMLDGKEVIITSDKSVKLQLIRPSINFLGKEVLATSFKRCENSNSCGSEECCFNSRCWSKDLVTQCVDQVPVIGNQEIGANCTSDFECSSLCCNQSTGSCSPHNPNGTNPIFCGKFSGQQCVSKEFCRQEPIVTCKIVKSGFNLNGTQACSLRCPSVLTYGSCTSGICIPPVTPAIPLFNPADCSTAVDP